MVAELRRNRARSIRFRITLAATLIVALATLAGAGLFVVVLRGSLYDSVLNTARADATTMAARIAESGINAARNNKDQADAFYQVVDVSGTVIASSPNAADRSFATQVSDESRTVTVDGVEYSTVTIAAQFGTDVVTPVPTPSATPSPEKTSKPNAPATTGTDDNSGKGSSDDNSGKGSSGGSSSGSSSPTPTPSTTSTSNSGKGSSGDSGDDGGGSGSGSGKGKNDDGLGTGVNADLVPAAFVATVAEHYVVVAGRSTATASATIGTVMQLLAVALPLLIILIAASSWFTVARSLRPVDRMRAELDDVTSANLHQRIANPGSSDEIGRLAITMNRMLDRLDGSQQAQRRFVSDASHELKSPLASLRQYAEVASSHPDRISQDELSDAVLDEGARLERLVQGMLVLARADEQSLVAGTFPVDLDDIVLADARRLKAAGNLTIDTSSVGPARVLGDEGMLAQVVRNLIDNAARHASTTVALSLSESRGKVRLAVDDDGSGVAEEQREAIFDRFVRLDEARARQSGGSGLGLSIVRELVTAHGGTVEVGNSDLGGARFTVTIPAT